ncbi:MAG: hypothetical protein CMC82_00550 [Flavobacteriaceae bacterium]|nr:hypothetical protein [Flavobacteriaceae bacterium]
MAGYSNTPPASEFHRYSSWGRTRRPKNIAGSDGTKVVSKVSLAACKAITDGITDVSKESPANGVYSTENQRFLHLTTTNGGQVDEIYVYHYASAVWSQLVYSGHDQNNASITVPANTCKVIEIAGVDLVAFKLSDSTDVYAACSTF